MAVEFDCFLIDEAMVVGDARFHDRCVNELFVKRKDRSFILVSHDANKSGTTAKMPLFFTTDTSTCFPIVDAAYEYYQSTLASPPPASLPKVAATTIRSHFCLLELRKIARIREGRRTPKGAGRAV